MTGRRRHLRVRLPHRVGLREVGARAADRGAQRARVRHGHGDRVHPRDRRDLQSLGEAHDGLGERLPREVRLVAGEQDERAPQRVVRERELQPRRTVVGEVVCLERDDRAPGAVVQQHVVDERDHGRGLQLVAEEVDDLRDGAAGIREPGERDDQRQSRGHRRRGRDTLVERTGDRHVSTLRAPVRRRLRPCPADSEHRRPRAGWPRDSARTVRRPCRLSLIG